MHFLDELKRRKVFRVAAVYVAGAFAILEGTDLLVGALGGPAWALTAVAISAVVGFPVALIVSWAFELSEEGLRRTGDAARDGEQTEAPAPVLGPRTLAVVAALVLVGVGMGTGWLLRAPAGGGGDAVRPSVAVVPFENSSPDSDDQYLSDGLAEAVIVALRSIPDIDVAARSSSWQFKGSNAPPRVVADSLGVSSVVAGTLRRSGDEVRITVELVAADGEPLWSEQFQVTVDDLFATQDRISRSIANTFRIRLTEDQRSDNRRPENPEAYNLYLRGRYNLALRTVPAILEATRNFGDAIALDSTFALAWAGLGEAWMLAAVWEGPGPATRMFSESMRALDRASALDPSISQAHAARGFLLYWVGRWEDGEGPLEHALELDPLNGDALQWLAHLYARTGREEEAEVLIERALDREPFSRGVVSGGASVYATFRPEEAIAHGRRLIELGHTQTGLEEVWHLLVLQGRLDEAEPLAREWVAALDRSEEGASDRIAFMERVFDAFREYAETGVPVDVPRAPLGSFAVEIQLMGGRPDVALEMLNQLFREDSTALLGMLERPTMFALRDDPRFVDLRERMRVRFGG